MTRRQFTHGLVGFTLSATVGCSAESDGRTEVFGRVTLDGRPLESGSIVFIPVRPNKGPKASGPIRVGQYHIARAEGPRAGKLRVEIRAAIEVPYDLDDPRQHARHGRKPFPAQRIPPNFNNRSELAREATLDGPNQFDFDLKSVPKPPTT